MLKIVIIWLSDQVTEWPSDQVTKWPSDQVTEWQEALQTIDRMVYFDEISDGSEGSMQ